MPGKQHICVKKLAIWAPALKWLFVGISTSQLTCLFKSGDDNEGGDS